MEAGSPSSGMCFSSGQSMIPNHQRELLELVEFKLREVIPREPTLLVLVVGVPNVGKSALINSIHQIASSRFPVQEKMKRATVGPLPGVTQDIAGYKIVHQPSIYVLDTPGVLVPSIPDIETRLKLALAGIILLQIISPKFLMRSLYNLYSIRVNVHTAMHGGFLSLRYPKPCLTVVNRQK
nr:short integuments 2, mitochondrial-like [Quercus suber]